VITVSCSFLMGSLGTVAVGVLNAGLSDQHGRWRAVALTESTAVASIFAGLTPLTVGLLQHVDLSWRGALLLPALLLILLTLRYYGEPLPKPQRARGRASDGRKLPRSYWIYWTAIVFLDSVEFCTVYWGASFLENAVGLNRPNASTALSVFIVGMVLGRLVGSRLNRALPSGLILFASFGLALTGFPIFWLAPFPALNVAGLFLLGLGISNIYPLIVSAAVGAVPGNTDAATARFLLAVGIATLVPPFALGFVADLVDIRYAYGLVAPLLIAALVATLMAGRASAPHARTEYEVIG
jgi:fucose permease